MQTAMRKISGNFDVDTLAFVEANKDLHRTWWQENAGMPTNMDTLVEAKFIQTKTEKRKFKAEQRGVPKTKVRKYCFHIFLNVKYVESDAYQDELAKQYLPHDQETYDNIMENAETHVCPVKKKKFWIDPEYTFTRTNETED
jgi:hypothetical protein